ncbi:very-long-chain enoyl-CoA reductase [Elysia marginata]|uniref:Very-long-chain enoyl-CoA reductase n=1 Tax=Elysia marginata TaxID=1093978 RepID=A0AAV4FND6_9GAST|nr:very-long-chain enoyl-CoA reductase [Elysia marginata]
MTLLKTIRKSLSLITLDRSAVEQYLANGQSAFRPDRSTSDAIWTHKWLAAIRDIPIKITGIDTSAAFDTINREVLLKILEEIVKEDELRLIQFLLISTQINTINKSDIEVPFTCNVDNEISRKTTTTLPVIINKELSQANPHMKLKTSNDLHTIRLLAQHQNERRTFTRRITEFAEATDSDKAEANSR